jgi:hypothetical protein
MLGQRGSSPARCLAQALRDRVDLKAEGWLSLRSYGDRQRICVATGGERLGIELRCDRNPQVSCWSAARSR